MCAEEKDWIVDVLYDVQRMLENNGLTESADTLTSTILFSMLEIANMDVIDSHRDLERDGNAVNKNVVKFTRCRHRQI